MTTQPAIDMVQLAHQNEATRHAMNHLFVGGLVAMIPALALAVIFGVFVNRRR